MRPAVGRFLERMRTAALAGTAAEDGERLGIYEVEDETLALDAVDGVVQALGCHVWRRSRSAVVTSRE